MASSGSFREWRLRLSLTQREVAGLLGYSRRQIQSFDTGAELPRVVELAMKALECEHARYADDQFQEPRSSERG